MEKGGTTNNLKQRVYTRAELQEIFQSDRTDLYRSRLKRAGYTFESGGRGQGYWIKITGLPEPPSEFEKFVKREFSCGPQTNFKAMKTYLFLLFNYPDFEFLPSNHQAKYLKDNYNIAVRNQTLRNWQGLLIDRNWIAKDKASAKYYLCRKGESPREITEEEYKKAWHRYFALTASGIGRESALYEIFEEYDGMPRKQAGLIENALFLEKLQELWNVLEE